MPNDPGVESPATYRIGNPNVDSVLETMVMALPLRVVYDLRCAFDPSHPIETEGYLLRVQRFAVDPPSNNQKARSVPDATTKTIHVCAACFDRANGGDQR